MPSGCWPAAGRGHTPKRPEVGCYLLHQTMRKKLQKRVLRSPCSRGTIIHASAGSDRATVTELGTWRMKLDAARDRRPGHARLCLRVGSMGEGAGFRAEPGNLNDVQRRGKHDLGAERQFQLREGPWLPGGWRRADFQRAGVYGGAGSSA